MSTDMASQIAALQRQSMAELRASYLRLFGEATRTGHRVWLIKRLAWRLQALAEGDLSERARRRAAELAHDADLRLGPPRPRVPRPDAAPTANVEPTTRSNRLPPPGTVLVRRYKGQTLQVQVRADGFEYAGSHYASLSAVAKAITGTHTSGFLFFRLQRNGANP